MEETIMTPKSFGISYEVTVVSAHRLPEQMFVIRMQTIEVLKLL